MRRLRRRHDLLLYDSSSDIDTGDMFLRIWLFGIYLASLESFFLDRADPVWFTFLVAVIGLHYLSRFRTTS